ncbi:hypothetical protein QBC43DRAFT_39898 [Cladorrhinum sp. PSN259]|nr:hypothetical protein QBC43DRAFT_39898 [Cladorrhinum sp. PSN259]
MPSSTRHIGKPKATLSELEIESCCDDTSPPSPPPSRLPTTSESCLPQQNTIYSVLKAHCNRAGPVLFKLLTILTFLLATFALWPTMESAQDTRRSTGLAEWSSKKEFIEFCEGHEWQGNGCEIVKGYELGPPPGFLGRMMRLKGRGTGAAVGRIVMKKDGKGRNRGGRLEPAEGSKGGSNSWKGDDGREEMEAGECPNELFLARRILLGRRECKSIPKKPKKREHSV